VVVVIEIIFRFYQTSMRKEDMQELSRDLQQLVISAVVKGEVYKILMVFSRYTTFLEDRDLRQKFKELRKLQTHDFGISQYFVLNEMSGIFNYNTTLQAKTKRGDSLMDEYQDVLIKEEGGEGQKEEGLGESVIERRLKRVPYEEEILLFRSMGRVESTLGKFKLLICIKQRIVQSVEEFWNAVDVPREKLSPARDDVIGIFTYIISKAAVKDCFAHRHMMERFSDEYLRYKAELYADAFSTFEAALEYLKGLDASRVGDKEYVRNAFTSSQMEHSINPVIDLRDSFNPFSLSRSMAGTMLMEGSSRLSVATTRGDRNGRDLKLMVDEIVKNLN